MKLSWSRRAVADLEAIAVFISADDPSAARRWIEAIRVKARKAAATPGIGRQVPEYADAHVREVLHRTYRIVYREARNGITVLHVTEGHRLLPPRRDL